MTNYSELSDFEINKRVAEAYLGYIEISQRFVNTGIDSSKHYCEDYVVRKLTNNERHWRKFDPCSSWGDAGPIIVENWIEIHPRNIRVGKHEYVSGWGAKSTKDDWSEFHECESPLRAAMIVYLMMKEADNA